MTDRIYLDNSTTSKPSLQALLAQTPYHEEFYGSLASPHQFGQELLFAIKREYNDLYDAFGVPADDKFVFTSSGSESVTQVAHSVYSEIVKKQGKNHFIARSIDEAAPIMAFSRLEEEACMLTLAPMSPHGYLTPQSFIEACTPRTALFSCSWASGLTGVIQPIEEIAAICKQRGILLHLDATHAIGKLTTSFSATSVDYLTFNGEQFHAPKGIGGLFAKKEAPLVSLILGEAEETLLRGACFNAPLFASLVQAAREAKEDQNIYCTEVARLRNLFEEGITKELPYAKILFQDEERLPHISCIAFPGLKSEAFALSLSRKGVYACMGGGPHQLLERVLTSCQIEKPYSQCALSFSLSKETKESEMERAIRIIAESAKRMKRISKLFFAL